MMRTSRDGGGTEIKTNDEDGDGNVMDPWSNLVGGLRQRQCARSRT
jgi:hypothetical protein